MLMAVGTCPLCRGVRCWGVSVKLGSTEYPVDSYILWKGGG